MQHLREAEESSFMKAVREAQESSVTQHLREAEESSFMKAVREAQESSATQHLREAEESSFMKAVREAQELSATQHLREAEESSFMKAVREAAESPILIELRRMEQSPFIREFQDLDKSTFMHDVDGFRSVSDHIAEIISPSIITSTSLSTQNWQSTLYDRLGSLRLDWLDPDPARSISGFSHLARLHDSIHLNDPFSEPVTQLVNRELGEPSTCNETEVLAASNGFNSDITAFDDDHYIEVIEIAGFEIDLPRSNTSTHAAQDGSPLTFCNKSGRLLRVLEDSLRFAIKKSIYRLGKSDNQVFPGQIFKNCQEKQRAAKERTGSYLELIYYTDFMELLSLIVGRILWNAYFKEVFINKVDFQASMQRIHPIRIEIAHSRPISKENLITFAVESQRILKALERATLIE